MCDLPPEELQEYLLWCEAVRTALRLKARAAVDTVVDLTAPSQPAVPISA